MPKKDGTGPPAGGRRKDGSGGGKGNQEREVLIVGDLVQLNSDWVEVAETFLRSVKEGRITHGAIIYRAADGELEWGVLGYNEKTYVVGLLERLKQSEADAEQIWEEEGE